jgi:[acyl-carrier-protein] S-malonyltransferase
MRAAFLFPGQGSQYPGMGRELAAKYAVARETFAAADRALGFAISELCFQGPEEALKLTENTQPALLTCAAAVYRILEQEGVRPVVVAGHSLGEYAAIVAAGGLALEDAVVTVRKRGQYMQEAVPPGEGAMAALLGMKLEAAEEVCRDAAAASGQVCSPANINSPEQVVIAGHDSAVRQAVDLAKNRGAKRAVMLAVSAPFHCSLMKPAQERLATDLEAMRFADLRVPLVNNLSAQAVTAAAQVRDGLIGQVSAPVLWERSMRGVAEMDVNVYVEAGPGRVLCGLLRQIDRAAKAVNVEDEKSLLSALALFKG